MLLKLLGKYLRRHTVAVTLVVVLQLIAALAALFLPRLNAQLIDEGVTQGDVGLIIRVGMVMIAAAIGQIIAAILATYFAAQAAMSVGRDLRADIYAKVGRFSEREVSQFGAGSLITRNTNDVQQVQMVAMMGATMLIQAPLLSGGGVIMAVQQDVGLSWILAISIPVMLVIAVTIMLLMVPRFKRYQERLDALNRVMREQLTGVRVVRAFVRERIEEQRFRDANDEIRKIGRNVGTLFVLLFSSIMGVLNITIVGVVWFGAFEVEAGTTQIGTLFAFIQYVGAILGGVMMAAFMVLMVPRAAVSADRIGEVFAVQSGLDLPDQPVRGLPERGAISFDGVGYRYPGADAPVLSDVSFGVRPGQTLAIVGATGAGKSTLVNLIPRLFDPSTGVVAAQGADVRSIDPQVLWSGMGIVPQRAFLFAGTVRSNLLFAKEDATDEEMWWALGVAQAEGFVREMDGGLDARISQGGTNVSGGQRQRLSIARAIIRRPDILIFDDSFSALDLTTDARLRGALWRELPEATKVVVAQRVSTITEADQIIVIDAGTIAARGTHDELVESSEIYREIVDSQLGVDA